MKRIFPIIVVLISVSLIGIIFIQISWLDNMLLAKKEQIQEKVANLTHIVAKELSQTKGFNITTKQFPDFDEFPLEQSKSQSLANRLTADDIKAKIDAVFASQKVGYLPYQFGLTSIGEEALRPIERQSPYFKEWYEDSVNYFSVYGYVSSLSGTVSENLSPDEVIIISIPIKQLVYRDLRPRIIAAVLFTLVIISAFGLTVYTMIRQKKLNVIKNDFINNMTHEFKTPIATISLAVDALKNPKVIGNPEKMTYFSSIIKEENQRMNRQVETILKSALMDRQEIQLNKKPLHLHQIIEDVADNFVLRLQEKGGDMEIHLNADTDLIEGDEVHINNLVNNLLDNAVKYSKDNVAPHINLSTSATAKKFILRIEDNGIGMTRETVKRIFEKFYRAHTGNIHNVKGFGLGLSYVKTVVEGHDGTIKPESTLGKGSVFTIELPLKERGS
ncbi:MAG: HAMP domain-containing histidine kinase [Chitinophagaceae bacterium]|nr:MAG: HAMP domain-containing histidine kinase [Chitinophagaceae bacterium]